MLRASASWRRQWASGTRGASRRIATWPSGDLKHGRIGMMAIMGYITPEPAWKFPGICCPSLGLEYAGFPSGLAAVPKVPALDWTQIAACLGYAETGTAFALNAGLGTAVFGAPVQAEHMDQAALLVERTPVHEPATLPVQTDESALVNAGAQKFGCSWVPVLTQQVEDCTPAVVQAVGEGIQEHMDQAALLVERTPELEPATLPVQTDASALANAVVVTDDLAELLARGKQVMSQFGPLAASCASFLEAGVADGTAVFGAPGQAEQMDQAALLDERIPALEPATQPVKMDESAVVNADAQEYGYFWELPPGLSPLAQALLRGAGARGRRPG